MSKDVLHLAHQEEGKQIPCINTMKNDVESMVKHDNPSPICISRDSTCNKDKCMDESLDQSQITQPNDLVKEHVVCIEDQPLLNSPCKDEMSLKAHIEGPKDPYVKKKKSHFPCNVKQIWVAKQLLRAQLNRTMIWVPKKSLVQNQPSHTRLQNLCSRPTLLYLQERPLPTKGSKAIKPKLKNDPRRNLKVTINKSRIYWWPKNSSCSIHGCQTQPCPMHNICSRCTPSMQANRASSKGQALGTLSLIQTQRGHMYKQLKSLLFFFLFSGWWKKVSSISNG
ncbi:hypothetical protein KP509_28G061400 [Ceratopteris richardii]|uniref:Uncharacterized protein n=1 Tax=Ceratopteris richardii TaxID=49495 RepID=A0A8T2RED2_CERRI|nr:hypothetical protein KP509_28G061400 [Ceratopteris richardii]